MAMDVEAAEIVIEQVRLEELCRGWRDAGRFAFDTEFIRDETFDAVLCLIQVACNGEVVLIDPTAGLDLAVFWDLVADEQVVTVVHAGKEDFELCLRMTERPPRNVFDIQIAAGFVGVGYPLSLVRLVDQVLRRRISKGQTLTDWLRRPLTDEQVRYAIEDVLHLPAIHSELSRRLEQRGRLSWAVEEFRQFEKPEFYRPAVEDRLFKLKGSKRLDGLGLVVLGRLIEWRDEWARQRNRPTRALIRDDVLVEIARRRPKKATSLQVLRGFPQAKNKHVVNALLEIIEQAGTTPRDEWPKPFEPRDDFPMTRVTLDILSAVTRAVCHEEGVSHDLVGSTQRLQELLDFLRGERTDPPILMSGWRAEFIGQRLSDLLEGRCELHLDGWPDDTRLEVVNAPTRRRKSGTEA